MYTYVGKLITMKRVYDSNMDVFTFRDTKLRKANLMSVSLYDDVIVENQIEYFQNTIKRISRSFKRRPFKKRKTENKNYGANKRYSNTIQIF